MDSAPESKAGQASPSALSFDDASDCLEREFRFRDLGYNCLRLCYELLRVTLRAGLKRNLIPKEEYFTEITGIAAPHVWVSLQRLEKWRIFQRRDNWYNFLAPTFWDAPFHAYFERDKNRRALSLQRELWLIQPSPEQFDWEAGPDLKLQLLEEFLENPRGAAASPLTGSVSQLTGSVSKPLTGSVSEQRDLINVNPKRDLKRSTLNAPKGRRGHERENALLDQAERLFLEFEDPERVKAEMDGSGAHLRKCAFFYPTEFETAIADAREEGRRAGFTGNVFTCLNHRTLDFINLGSYERAWAAKPEKVAEWQIRCQNNRRPSINRKVEQTTSASSNAPGRTPEKQKAFVDQLIKDCKKAAQ
jgi:hypothetical protein